MFLESYPMAARSLPCPNRSTQRDRVEYFYYYSQKIPNMKKCLYGDLGKSKFATINANDRPCLETPTSLNWAPSTLSNWVKTQSILLYSMYVSVTLIRSIITLCGTDSSVQNISGYYPTANMNVGNMEVYCVECCQSH